MRLLIAAIADYANIAQGGKLNLAGVFDTIYVRKFPARHGQLYVAMRLQFDYDDFRDEPHAIAVTLADQDGRPLAGATGRIPAPRLEPGHRVVTDQLLVFNDIVFQGPNEYSFIITWDGIEQQRLPLTVQSLPVDQRPA